MAHTTERRAVDSVFPIRHTCAAITLFPEFRRRPHPANLVIQLDAAVFSIPRQNGGGLALDWTFSSDRAHASDRAYGCPCPIGLGLALTLDALEAPPLAAWSPIVQGNERFFPSKTTRHVRIWDDAGRNIAHHF